MSGNRLDSERSFLDELLLDEFDEDEVVAILGQGGPDKFHGKPSPGYGGHFSSADGMTAAPAMPEVTDENWRVVGDKVVFDRDASKSESSGTKRLIKPEEVPGAKTEGERVPLSKRNITASFRGNPGVWVVPEKSDDSFDLAGTVCVEDD